MPCLLSCRWSESRGDAVQSVQPRHCGDRRLRRWEQSCTLDGSSARGAPKVHGMLLSLQQAAEPSPPAGTSALPGAWDSGESLGSRVTELEKRIRFACMILRNTNSNLIDIFYFFLTWPPGSEGPRQGRTFSLV